MKRMLLIIGLISLILLAGCQKPSSNKFWKACSNPTFIGSEGITHNEDLDRAFEKSKPILNFEYRYYDGPEGNALWSCD